MIRRFLFALFIRDNGFVGSDGVLKIPVSSERIANDNHEEIKPSTGTFAPPSAPGFIEIPIPLHGGKRAYLKIPEDYKPEDCERISKFVDALK